MRFYLVYKNRGLYDPIIDDSEEILLPVGPNDLDQGTDNQEIREHLIESTESKEPITEAVLETSKPYKAENLGDIGINLNQKDVFPELYLEELPPQTKYKLPVSEQYDPEGKRLKQKVFNQNIVIDFDKIKHTEETKVAHKTEDIIEKEIWDANHCESMDVEEYKHSNVLEEEIELRKIKQTALNIIEDSLNKAVALANQLKTKSEHVEKKLSSLIQKSLKTEEKSFQQTKEKVKTEKRVSFKDDLLDEKVFSEEVVQREVHVADEVKKFESFDLQMDSRLNAEERKMLTQRDIEEAIEAGTVRQRTDMFKGNDRIMRDKSEKKVDTVKTNKSNIEVAQQRVYKIGLHVIPRVQSIEKYSSQSRVMLKTFLFQMTKVLMTLYKFIPKEQRYNFMKSRQFYEEYNKKCREYVHADDDALRGDNFMNSESKKSKLSGAKLAQIQGHKPVELTDRMNIVISEFLKKSGKEDVNNENEYRGRKTASSRNESTVTHEYEHTFDERQSGDTFSRETFSGKAFNENKSENNFVDGTFEKNTLANKKMFEETYEKTFEFREFEEEKRHSESTSKYDSKVHSYESKAVPRHDFSVPITYIAIVEAHVYTNKDAIFEEQLRRMSESIKQTDVTESGIIYYRCEVSVFYRQFREPSLPPTVVIESIEEIPSDQVFEEEQHEIIQESTYEYEDATKKLAVQKISEVIEPLLQIKEVKSVSIKQAYPTIETPLKLITEQTTVTLEKEEDKRIEIHETVDRKPKLIEPTKSIAQTSEVYIEEETVGLVDISRPIAQLPRPVKVKGTVKSAAETMEVHVDEANLNILNVSQTIGSTPQYTIADNLRSIAEITEVSINEKEEDSIGSVNLTPKEKSGTLKEKPALSVGEIKTVLTFELPAQPFDTPEFSEKHTQPFIQDKFLVAAETLAVIPEEPNVSFDINESLKQKAHFEVIELRSTTVTSTSAEEPNLQIVETPKVADYEPYTAVESSLLTVAENKITLPSGPHHGYLETPSIETKRPKTLIEGGLLVAQTTLVSATSPEGDFNLVDTIHQRANVKVEESKAITTSFVYTEEPKENKLDAIHFQEKKPIALLQDALLTVPTKLEIIPEGPKDINFDTHKPVQEKADVDIEELKSASVSVVTVEEPKDGNLEQFTYTENEIRCSIEKPVLTAAQTYTTVPEGPLYDLYEPPKIISDKAGITIDELKPILISIVTPSEPQEEAVDTPRIRDMKPQSLIEDRFLPVVQTTVVVPEESKIETYAATRTVNKQAKMNIEVYESAESTIISAGEPREERLDLVKYEMRQQHPSFEAIHLTAPETSVILAEEPRTTFDVTETTSRQASIQIIEQQTTKGSLVFPLEPRDQELVIPEIVEKKPRTSLECPVLTAALNSFTIPEENAHELPEVIKPVCQKANINVVGLKVADTITLSSHEPASVFTTKKSESLIEKLCKMVTVEDTTTGVAKATSVSVEVAKERPVLEELVLSSPPSTVSSAPSSPFVQEYVFGEFVIGHSYRVQSPQETSLDIVKPAKELYGVDAADTSFTLTFEAEYEDEKEVLCMEEFSDVVKRDQFWISDIKTMETLKNSNVRIGVDASTATIQDITVIKSRSQSFDESADFEVSLQQSKAIPDVQAVATIDLKSVTGFQTTEDVESQALVNIKSKSAKAYSEQSVDVAYGLTIENDIVVDAHAIDLNVQTSQDTKIAKSTRRVKKASKEIAMTTSKTETEASYDYEADLELRSTAVVEGSLEASRISDASYLATAGNLESNRVSKSVEFGSISRSDYAEIEGSMQSKRTSEGRYAAVQASLELSSVSQSMEASLESRSISQRSNATIGASLEASSVSSSSHRTQQESLQLKSRAAEIDKGLIQTGTEMEVRQKLSLQTEFKKDVRSVKSPSPEDIPSPLRDEYIFRLITEEPEETIFIPRDCSFTPESVHDEPITAVNGLIPHIDTKIVRVLYSPPLETPPELVRKIDPVFTKPGLRGGSETPDFVRSGLKSGSETPDFAKLGYKSGSHTPRQFTKEEILEIGRKSALLALEIDKTIRSIEEYKESVGISNKREGRDDKETEQYDMDNNKDDMKCLMKENSTRAIGDQSDLTKADNDIPNKRLHLLSKFTHI